MTKYTPKQQNFPINRVKEGFAVNILVFVFQLHQRF
jgi:hypothetical protein